jgi:hypothetical protein
MCILQNGQVDPLTFPVIAERHLCLSKADRVFARGNAIELLKLALVNTLEIISCFPLLYHS